MVSLVFTLLYVFSAEKNKKKVCSPLNIQGYPNQRGSGFSLALFFFSPVQILFHQNTENTTETQTS